MCIPSLTVTQCCFYQSLFPLYSFECIRDVAIPRARLSPATHSLFHLHEQILDRGDRVRELRIAMWEVRKTMEDTQRITYHNSYGAPGVRMRRLWWSIEGAGGGGMCTKGPSSVCQHIDTIRHCSYRCTEYFDCCCCCHCIIQYSIRIRQSTPSQSQFISCLFFRVSHWLICSILSLHEQWWLWIDVWYRVEHIQCNLRWNYELIRWRFTCDNRIIRGNYLRGRAAISWKERDYGMSISSLLPINIITEDIPLSPLSSIAYIRRYEHSISMTFQGLIQEMRAVRQNNTTQRCFYTEREQKRKAASSRYTLNVMDTRREWEGE